MRIVTRRGLLTPAAAVLMAPRATARLAAANDRLNVACVGVGGIGKPNRQRLVKAGVEIVALCDVDSRNLAVAAQEHPRARTWADFRVMLEKQKEIDAVFVSTPDHTHASVAMAAMKLGKHVCCEKPLAHSIGEVRALAAAARRYKVATQLDNEGHAFDGLREIVEWIQAGVIGEVREVHAWQNSTYQPKLARPEPQPVPDYLNWDLWLGPAPYRDFHAGLHPGSWRGWWDFGSGVLGDWCGHFFDAALWSLNLGMPSTVEAESGGDVQEAVPAWSVVRYRFPARGKDLPALTLTWYDGGKLPPRPEELKPGEELPAGGYLFVGSKGKLLVKGRRSLAESDKGWLLPAERMEAFQAPKPTLPRVPNQEHLREWIDACKGGKPASCRFEDYGGRLTEIGLLGNVAIRAGRTIEWDAERMRAVDLAGVDRFVRLEYRKGWEL